MDKKELNSVSDSVTPTTGPSLTPPLPKSESEKRADAPKNVNIKGSGRPQ